MDDKEEEINRRTIRRRIPHLNVGTCHPAPPEEGWWDVPLVRDETNLGTRESATASATMQAGSDKILNRSHPTAYTHNPNTYQN